MDFLVRLFFPGRYSLSGEWEKLTAEADRLWKERRQTLKEKNCLEEEALRLGNEGRLTLKEMGRFQTEIKRVKRAGVFISEESRRLAKKSKQIARETDLLRKKLKEFRDGASRIRLKITVANALTKWSGASWHKAAAPFYALRKEWRDLARGNKKLTKSEWRRISAKNNRLRADLNRWTARANSIDREYNQEVKAIIKGAKARLF